MSEFTDIDALVNESTSRSNAGRGRQAQGQAKPNRVLPDGTELTSRGKRIGKIFLRYTEGGLLEAESSDSPQVLEAFKELAPVLTMALEKKPDLRLRMANFRLSSGAVVSIASVNENRRTGNADLTMTLKFSTKGSLPIAENTVELEGVEGLTVGETYQISKKLSAALDAQKVERPDTAEDY